MCLGFGQPLVVQLNFLISRPEKEMPPERLYIIDKLPLLYLHALPN